MQINMTHPMIDTAVHPLAADNRRDKRTVEPLRQERLNDRYAVLAGQSPEDRDDGRVIIEQIQQELEAGRLDTPQAIRLAALCLLRYGI